MSTGLWPSFLERDGDGDIVEAVVVGEVSPKQRQRQGLGAACLFGRKPQEAGGREWGGGIPGGVRGWLLL